ncbi:uncharacterized protein LOC135841104 [Planococcus citri]|uniref:uncharacterized protein LOC135841104 n=1 Tax=Planococcus citri TaxID=170843 RepID=UPI0031F9A643
MLIQNFSISGNRVIALSDVPSREQISKDTMLVDPLSIFRTIISSKKHGKDLKNYFSYELSPIPLPLFSLTGMRKTSKSNLFKFFPALTKVPNLENATYVIDGGFLLHRVLWIGNSTYGELCDKYVEYVQTFGSDVMVVFDGYEDTKNSTKNAEHLRRLKRKGSSPDLIIDQDLICTIPQENFLTNTNNKVNFIRSLCSRFQEKGIDWISAKNDADKLIVNTAIQKSRDGENAVIVGEDTDLLLLAVVLSEYPLLMMKPAQPNTVDKYFSVLKIKKKVPSGLLFLHLFTGSDTTNAFYGKDKVTAISILIKKSYLSHEMDKFYDPNADPNAIVQAGEIIAAALYGANKERNLNEYRYKCFEKLSKNKREFDLSQLPPTKAALEQHSKRVYYELQNVIGNTLDPVKFGWHCLF